MTGKELQDLIRKLLRSRRNDTLALIAVVVGPIAVKLYAVDGPLVRVLFCAAVVICVGSVLWLTFRIGRTVEGEDPSFEDATGIATRGLAPYTDSDRKLFWRLRRISDIRRLSASIHNTTVSVVVLHGEDGVGKTSVLWAGLKPLLEQEGIQCVYCDAADPDPVGAVAGAIRDKLNVGRQLAQIPTIQSRTALIIDSFERLDLATAAHASFLALLRAVHEQSSPHMLQLIIAFRDHYKPTWIQIEREIGIRAEHLILKRLSQDEARRCMETMLEQADISVDRKIVRDYIQKAASNNRVSPVDIAVGGQIFESWASSLPGRRLTIADYVATGGALGVLMAHVRERLDDPYVLKEDHAALIHGLAAELIDSNSNRRNLAGISASEIAEKHCSLNVDRLEDDYLPDLAARDTRILEVIPGQSPTRYGLARESLVPVVRQLDHELTTPSDPAYLFFIDQYERWQKTQRRRDLLRGRSLNLASKYLSSGNSDNIELNAFIHKSGNAQRWRRALSGVAALVVVGAFVSALLFKGAYTQETKLSSWLLPSELYKSQDQLKSVRIKSYSVSDLDWLRNVDYDALEITDSRLTSASGLANPRSIDDLTIALNGTRVATLAEIARIPALKSLTLSLGNSQVKDLSDLEHATKLEALSLDLGGSNITSLAALDKVPQLTGLALQIAGSSMHDLSALNALSNMQTLSLSLDSSQLDMIADIGKVDHLHDLSISIENPRHFHDLPKVRNIPPIAGMENLRKFVLQLTPPPPSDQVQPIAYSAAPITNLHTLVLPQGIHDLTIDVGGFPVAGLPALAHLDNLESLKLGLHGSAISQLPDFKHFRALKKLDLSLDGPQLKKLHIDDLARLTSLRLQMQGRDIKAMPPITGLSHLQALTIDISQSEISSIPDFSAFHELRTLELRLKWSQLRHLHTLANLDELNDLSLFIVGENQSDFPVLGIQNDLPNLTLSLTGPSVRQLPDLTQFKGVQRLSLVLTDSGIQTLDSITKLATLQSLTLDLTNTQALRRLPDMSRFSGLTDLSVIMDGSPIDSLQEASRLTSLSSVTLNLRNSHITDLMQIQQLPVRELILDQRCGSLKGLPRRVERLTFWWRA